MTLPTVYGEKPPVLILGDFPESILFGDRIGDFAEGDFERSALDFLADGLLLL